jgi:hypothetical protein
MKDHPSAQSSRAQSRNNITAGLLLPVAVLSLAGCSGVGDSLNLRNQLLVKVPPTAQQRDQRTDPSQRPLNRLDIHASNGWTFRHVASAPEDRYLAGEWYVALLDNKRHLPASKRIFPDRWERARLAAPSIADATREMFGAYPLMIEPNFEFSGKVGTRATDLTDKPDALSNLRAQTRGPVELQVNQGRSGGWPAPARGDGNAAWHLGPRVPGASGREYSQLALARERLHGAGKSEAGIRIGIIDNGFSKRNLGTPEHIEQDQFGDALEWTRVTPLGAVKNGKVEQGLSEPGAYGSSHGTGTIGLLAGRNVSIKSAKGGGTVYEGYLGGAPDATIVPVRVAPWVFSIETSSMAYAIDYASRVKHCDVISMSHGGAPSEAWVDAVNAAYDRGTAMFAAESNFLSLSPAPFPPFPLLFVPSSPVYPAGFRRVMGVTGATSDDTTYAQASFWRILTHLSGNLMRGSYGPDGFRRPFHTQAVPDASSVGRMGLLRAYPIAAYSPNTPWLHASTKKDPGDARVDLNGAGTSAATPQAAAAAALWMAMHKGEFTSREWHSGRKAEAAYLALLSTAQRHGVKPDPYLGAGILRADEALKKSYKQLLALNKKRDQLRFAVAEDPDKWWRPPHDHFDGTRSIWALFFGVSWGTPPLDNRADLEQTGAIADRAQAMQRLFYNTGLLESWHNGSTPAKGARDPLYDRAGRMASRYEDLSHTH